MKGVARKKNTTDTVIMMATHSMFGLRDPQLKKYILFDKNLGPDL